MVLLCSLTVISLPEGSIPRLLITGVALLFIPGYALTLAVFPGSRTEQMEAETPLNRRYFESTMSSLDPFERLALAVGFGVCLTPVYGSIIALAGVEYEAQTIIVLVSAATAIFTLLAGARHRISSTAIDAPSPFSHLAGVVADEISAPTTGKKVLNAAVVVMLLFAAMNLTAAMVSPPQSPEYTTAVLLTENDQGELIADGYPDQLRAGETTDLVLQVENRESRAVNYEVIVQIQRVSADGTVTELSVRDRFERTVASGSVWKQDHRVTSDMSGDRVRLAYLIYKGDAPAEPTIGNSYRNLTLWVGSDESAGTEDTTAGSLRTPLGSSQMGAL
jgi:uncharacterized membrane protein